MAYKRRTKKTGSTTRTTTTQRSGKGTRITHSTKSSLGGKNTRTRSTSFNKDGRLRQTTTDSINGWITRRTKIHGTSRRKSGGRRSSRKGDDLLLGVVLWLMFLPFKLAYVILRWFFRLLFGR